MTTKKLKGSTRPPRENLEHAALTMAVGIVVDRIDRLSQADRDDLYELVKGHAVAETSEERESIAVAMIEILDQERVQVLKMDLEDGPPVVGLQKWLDYVSVKIRELRKSASMTQEDLAAKSGLPQSHISRLEGGKHSPSHATLEKIATALSVPVSEIDPSA